MSGKNSIIPAEKLRQYQQVLQSLKGVEVKGDTMPYTSMNGNMFSFLDKEGNFALRLSADDRKEFITRFESGLFPAHGTVLKEYVTVPDKLFQDPAALQPYLQKSFKYVSSLKPKPARKK